MCERTRTQNSDMKLKFCQKNLRETPRAIEGTMIGTFTKELRRGVNLPAFLLAIIIATGKPNAIFANVAIKPIM